MKKKQPMDEDKLNAFLDAELRQTIGFGLTGDEVSPERKKNLEYYLNRPVGDEEVGRSQLQSSDVQDVIEAFIPSSLAPFISSDKVVEFRPVGKEDEEYSELAGLYVNHIFMVDNDGIKIQYTWQKDALIQKNGFVYADWCEKKHTARKLQKVDYSGLQKFTEDSEIEVLEYAAFLNGMEIDPKTIESVLASQDPMATDGMEFEVDFRRTWTEGRVKIENIPPEYVIVSNTAKDEGTARLIGWQEQVTVSSLREEGYDEDKIDGIGEESNTNNPSGERTAREQAQGGNNNTDYTSSTDPASKLVWRTVVWTKVDFDGDGKTELRKIIRGGSSTSGGVILLNEEADEVPIISFTPIPMPHQLFGRALADLTRSIQDGKTSMLRMGMDATYHTVYPRPLLNTNTCGDDTYNDLLMDIPGAPVRTDNLDAVSYLRDAPDIGAAYQMLEYLDRMREIRTPVTRQDQGVDIDALNDKTAREAQIQANASSMKKGLVLRLYAEALGRLFRLINRLCIKYQDKPRLLRLYPNRPPVEIDPRFWNADMDVTVRVGLGTGTKDQQLQGIMAILAEQKELIAVQSPLVDWDKLYNSLARLVEYTGLSSPESYFNDPNDPNAQPQVPQENPEAKAAAQQEEAAKIEQAIQQAHEQGKQEGTDKNKYDIEKMKVDSQEKMHKEKIDAEREDMMGVNNLKDGLGKSGEAITGVAQALGEIAQSLAITTQAMQQLMQMSAQNNGALPAAIEAMTS